VIILGTNIVTEPMKADGNSRVRNWLDDQIAETLYLTSISLSELLLAIQVLLGTSPSKPLHGGRPKV
jgi:predicted nucleic acid-binding protein